MPEYARVCQSMPEYARVCQSMPEYASNYIIIILYLYSTGKVLILWNMFAFDFDPLGGAEVLKIPSLQ